MEGCYGLFFQEEWEESKKWTHWEVINLNGSSVARNEQTSMFVPSKTSVYFNTGQI